MRSRYTTRTGWWRRTRGVRRFVLVALLVGMALLLHVASRGFPDRWTVRMARALSTETYRVDLEDVSFSPQRGLTIGRARVASRMLDHSEMLRMERANLRFRIQWGRPLLHWIRSIDVYRIEITALPRTTGGPAPDLPPFGPIALHCTEINLLGTTFRDATALLTGDGSQLNADQIRCDLSPPLYPMEMVAGAFSFGLRERSARGAISGDVNPVRLIPLLRALDLHNVATIVERFEFPAGPAATRVRLDYAPFENRRRVEASLAATACQYNNVPMMSAQATLMAEGKTEWETVRIEQLNIERPEGSARGVLVFDLVRNGLDFSATSTLDPHHLFALIGLFADTSMQDWRFGTPSEIVASGFYGFRGTSTPTAIEGTARMPVLHYQRYRLEDVQADFVVQPDRYFLPRATAKAYTGDLEANGLLLRNNDGDLVFSVTTRLQRARFGALMTAASGRPSEDPGRFDLNLQLNGNLSQDTLRSLHGEGRARIRESMLYRMPLFAGFTDFMARNVPGVDFIISQNDLNADFRIRDYGLRFSTLHIEGSVFSVSAAGDYWFTDHLDFGVQVHLLKHRTWLGRVLRVALFPVSKLLELELTGPLRDPSWSPTTLALRRRRGASEEQRGLAPREPPPGDAP